MAGLANSLWTLMNPKAGTQEPPKAGPSPSPYQTLDPQKWPAQAAFLAEQRPVQPDAVDSEDEKIMSLPSDDPMMLPILGLSAPPPAIARGPQRSGMSPEEIEMEKTMRQLMSDRQGRIDKASANDQALGDRPTGFQAVDLSPLMAFADSMAGTNIKAGYSGPKQLQDYDAQKKIMQAALDKERNGLGDDQMNYLKMKAGERTRRDSMDQAQANKDMMIALMGRRADQADTRIGIAKSRLQDSVYKSFSNDKNMMNYDNQLSQIGRGLHVLETPPGGIITYQMVKEISNDIANALSAGKSAVDDRHKAEFNTLAGEMARLAQFISANPTAATSPEQVAHLKGQLERIKEAFTYNMADRARTLKGDRNYVIGEANEAADKTAKYYDEKAKKVSAEISKPKAATKKLDDMSDEELKAYIANGGKL